MLFGLTHALSRFMRLGLALGVGLASICDTHKTRDKLAKKRNDFMADFRYFLMVVFPMMSEAHFECKCSAKEKRLDLPWIRNAKNR